MAKVTIASSVMVRPPVEEVRELRTVVVREGKPAVYEDRITLELSPSEVTALYALCGMVGGRGPSNRMYTDHLYNVLKPFAYHKGDSTYEVPSNWVLTWDKGYLVFPITP